ncbi:MAG TPA: thiamine phosphate synthase [Alloacidobacterium sp.]|nr:thiamine phosphate synthase [Alloacidobacterium sp.]
MIFELPRLYPIFDASFLPREDRQEFLRQMITELAEAGVSLLQYRNKRGTEAEILSDAAVMRQAAGNRIKLIMNDRPDLAVRSDFDGAHVGQEDVSPEEARRVLGDDRILGISTHNRAQVELADQQPVDYIATGPVFATSSKANPDPVIGIEGVRETRSLTSKTLVAIGGITVENAHGVLKAGADAVAVISALFAPGRRAGEAAREFLETLRSRQKLTPPKKLLRC